MGDYFQTVVDLDAGPADALALAQRGLDWLVREEVVRAEHTDCVLGAPTGHPPGTRWVQVTDEADGEPHGGLAVEAGRTVFDGGQGGARYAVCPHCTARTDLFTRDRREAPGAWEPFDAAIQTWHDTGAATVTCRLCGRPGDLPAWRWADDYFAFGYLGFEFWNWPEFSPRFLHRFAEALGGRRTVLVGGKL